MKNLILSFVLILAAGKVSADTLPVCVDRQTGERVPIITNAGNQNPAFSTLDPRTHAPEIFINMQVLPEFETSQDTVTFIVEHECGHVNLGHLNIGPVGRKKTNAEELAADCYAAQAVRQMGFTQADMQKVLTDVDKLPKDPDHPAGTVRAANIMRCYNNQQ